ncbi:C40 family peptidase [Corynebacterium urogenitale]
MGKHNLKKTNSTKRNAAIVAAVGVGAAVINPAAAQAAPVKVPNTNLTVEVPDQLMRHLEPHIGKATQAAAAAPAKASKPVAAPKSKGQQIVDFAMSKQGAPYAWGAAGPNAFDCSGLTSWAHKMAGIQIPRTSDAQAYSGKPVSLDNLLPGDVISYYGGASHVAIYVGNGKVVHAVNSGTPVQVNDIHYMPVNNAVRFF